MNKMKNYEKLISEINAYNYSEKTDEFLREQLVKVRMEAKGFGEEEQRAFLEKVLPLVFSITKEGIKRVLGLNAYDEQMAGGIALHKGNISEMATGEGKTLTAIFPAVLNGLLGKSVHILTFNDYLAHRDWEWMGPVYKLLGLSCGYVREGMNGKERKKEYECEVVYVTAREAGFDYLRDFIAEEKERQVHGGFYWALIDEADSILIDEARIPMVIAGKKQEGDYNEQRIGELVKSFKLGEDFDIDDNGNRVFLLDKGIEKAESSLSCENLYSEAQIDLLEGINNSLKAEFLLKRDVDYIVKDGKLILVDEFTGRTADKRQWPESLQRAVELKEGLEAEEKGQILASITMQNFIGLYTRVCGMTGTASAAEEELNEVYGLTVVEIPTNKPVIRNDRPDRLFFKNEEKLIGLVEEIETSQKKGQPILVGTASIEESEYISEELGKRGYRHQVLNAKNPELEASLIARAGEKGSIIVSTNMAGRGVEIKLGNGAAEAGGLKVIGFGRQESIRLDHQLRGRAGRQGDPGESVFLVSFEDPLVKKYDMLQLVPKKVMTKLGDGALTSDLVRKELERGQRIVEGYNSDTRRQLWKYSFILEEQRRIIAKRRQGALDGQGKAGILEKENSEKYKRLLALYGKEFLEEIEKILYVHFTSVCWSQHIEYLEYVREGIHLVVIGNKDPLNEFHVQAIDAFKSTLEEIDNSVLEAFEKAEITEKGLNREKEGINTPSSTWTYLINDNGNQFSNLTAIIKRSMALVKKPFAMLESLFGDLFQKKN